jgi:TRAP-type uncharacterized transport system fused permease subunit
MFGALNFEVTSMPVAMSELVLFLVTVPFMYKLGDLHNLSKLNNKNWALIIPLVAIIGPLFSLGRGQENALPTLLAIPSLFYIVLFVYLLFVWLRTRHTMIENAVS